MVYTVYTIPSLVYTIPVHYMLGHIHSIPYRASYTPPMPLHTAHTQPYAPYVTMMMRPGW